MKEFVTMKNKARFWKITILAVILVGVAGLATYRVIASTPTASLTCPVKDGSDKEACKLRSDDESKKTCPYKGQSDKKADCDKTKKQCDL